MENFQFLPEINADFYLTIDLALLLLHIPAGEEVLQNSMDPLKMILKDEPLTLQDLIDNNKNNTVMVIKIVLSVFCTLILLFTAIYCICRQYHKRSAPSAPLELVTQLDIRNLDLQSVSQQPMTQAARQIRLDTLK